MKKLTFGILGAAVVTAAVLIVRQAQGNRTLKSGTARAGEIVPSTLSLDRLRELGI